MDTHKDDEIDLIALLKTVFLARRFVVKTTILFAVFGVILALISPVNTALPPHLYHNYLKDAQIHL